MQQFENEPRTSSLSMSLSGIDSVAREINKLRTEVSLQVIDSSSKICSLRHPPRENPGRESSVRHRSDFFFDLGNIDHNDGVPRAAIQEAAVRALAEALLAPDALEGVDLDAPERR